MMDDLKKLSLTELKGALESVDVPTKDEEELIRWLKTVGLDKLQAEKNIALRQTIARAVIGFTDSTAKPPSDVMTALAWPRSRADELSKLLDLPKEKVMDTMCRVMRAHICVWLLWKVA